MSVDLHVFFDPAQMVTPGRWADAVREAGFAVDMDTDFDPLTFSGFLPCKYKNREAGFEYFYQVLQGEELREFGIGDSSRPACITFSTRSDFREFASSMICAAVLSSIVKGTLRDADGETCISDEQAIAWAKDGEVGIQRDIEEQDARRSHLVTPSAPQPVRSHKPWWKIW